MILISLHHNYTQYIFCLYSVSQNATATYWNEFDPSPVTPPLSWSGEPPATSIENRIKDLSQSIMTVKKYIKCWGESKGKEGNIKDRKSCLDDLLWQQEHWTWLYTLFWFYFDCFIFTVNHWFICSGLDEVWRMIRQVVLLKEHLWFIQHFRFPVYTNGHVKIKE